ncbi:MAG: hypothetical protein DHS20C21_09240 [Gemmatimonadota bacterium]|nr:MAG: hypothetical protein DHS20C21_09240 [Gemmatimonadota bacterium]
MTPVSLSSESRSNPNLAKSGRSILCAALVAAVALGGGAAEASEYDLCGTDMQALQGQLPKTSYPNSGTVQPLVVFVRFPDANVSDWGDDWPIDPTETQWDTLPSWANLNRPGFSGELVT